MQGVIINFANKLSFCGSHFYRFYMEEYKLMESAYTEMNSQGMGVGYGGSMGASSQIGYETSRRNKCARASCFGCAMC